MNVDNFRDSFESHRELLTATEKSCRESLLELCVLSAQSLQAGGKLLFFGNGGSAADAQHLVAEFTIRFIRDRRALAAIALSTNYSEVTACGNDLGFESIFSRQIEALGRKGDVAIGFSTSGNSPNVCRALSCARELGITAAAFTGGDGGKLRHIASPLIAVPSAVTARIQEMHILLGHILCGEIERHLDL